MAGARRCWRRAPSTYQPACKPGSVRRRANPPRDGHSSGTPVARRLQQPTRTTGPGHRSRSLRHAPSLFGLAPGGVCRAASVAGSAVRSYRTVSPLPPSPLRASAGGLLSVALSLKFAALARGFFRRTLSGTACPWSPDFPLRPAFRHWTQAAVRPTDAMDLGALRGQIKQSAGKPLTNAAASRTWIGRRCHRGARGGSGAGTP